eukprot:3720139-Ditylum_brightwellii.AAC.1
MLLLKDEDNLKRIASRKETLFPYIHGKEFQGPSKIVMGKFLEEVAQMDKVPCTDIILYFFKANSFQKERMGNKNNPLYFNLKIFMTSQVSSVKGFHEDHLAYEEGRILKTQPLLKDYKEARKKISDADVSTTAVPSSLEEKYQVLSKKEINGEGLAPFTPKRLCLNNKRLKMWADQNKAVI